MFETTFDFTVGDSYTLAWVGFEDCCGGSTTLRFSVDGGAFQDLTSTRFGKSAACVFSASTRLYPRFVPRSLADATLAAASGDGSVAERPIARTTPAGTLPAI